MEIAAFQEGLQQYDQQLDQLRSEEASRVSEDLKWALGVALTRCVLYQKWVVSHCYNTCTGMRTCCIGCRGLLYVGSGC